MRQAPIGSHGFLRCNTRPEGPVGVNAVGRTRSHDDRGARLELTQRLQGVVAVCVDPERVDSLDGLGGSFATPARGHAQVDVSAPAELLNLADEGGCVADPDEPPPHPLAVTALVAKLDV